MSKFADSWELETSNRFDDYLEALGVDMKTRLATKFLKPTLIFEVNGDKWTQKTQSTFKNYEVTFVLNEEFEEEMPDGRKIKSVYRLEGEKKLIKFEKGGKVNTVLTRELIDDNTLVLVAEAVNVVAKRMYKRKSN